MLNSGQNRRFFVPCDLEIWWMTLKNNKAPILCCFKLCASFHGHRWIQTKVTVRKRSIRVKICDLLSRVTLKFDRWPWKTIGHLFYVASSFMHHFITIGKFKRPIRDKIGDFLSCVTLKFDGWSWKLYASFHHHMWIQTGVTVRKRLSWVMTSVTLTFDLWPWPVAWTSLLSLVITPKNFVMIWWQERSGKGVTDRLTDRQTDRQADRRTDRQTDRQTERGFLRAAWSQLKKQEEFCSIWTSH